MLTVVKKTYLSKGQCVSGLMSISNNANAGVFFSNGFLIMYSVQNTSLLIRYIGNPLSLYSFLFIAIGEKLANIVMKTEKFLLYPSGLSYL